MTRAIMDRREIRGREKLFEKVLFVTMLRAAASPRPASSVFSYALPAHITTRRKIFLGYEVAKTSNAERDEGTRWMISLPLYFCRLLSHLARPSYFKTCTYTRITSIMESAYMGMGTEVDKVRHIILSGTMFYIVARFSHRSTAPCRAKTPGCRP